MDSVYLRGCWTEFCVRFSKSDSDNVRVKCFLKLSQIFDKVGSRKSIQILARDRLLWILGNGRRGEGATLCPLSILKHDWELPTFLSENVLLEFEVFIILLLLALFLVGISLLGGGVLEKRGQLQKMFGCGLPAMQEQTGRIIGLSTIPRLMKCRAFYAPGWKITRQGAMKKALTVVSLWGALAPPVDFETDHSFRNFC